jgi:hypothetical protein
LSQFWWVESALVIMSAAPDSIPTACTRGLSGYYACELVWRRTKRDWRHTA